MIPQPPFSHLLQTLIKQLIIPLTILVILKKPAVGELSIPQTTVIPVHKNQNNKGRYKGEKST